MEEFFSAKPRIGISACLLGQKVRYDGGHKRDALLTDTFGLHVEWIPVCPELEVGMGVPREPVRLVGEASDSRMIAERSGKDWTSAMQRFAAQRVRALKALGLCGYIFKKDSPSCGMERVRVYPVTQNAPYVSAATNVPNVPEGQRPKATAPSLWYGVYNRDGIPNRAGRGLFASAVMDELPLLPVEEEGRLSNPMIRENFVERIFAYHRWQRSARRRKSVRSLVDFHTRHKLLVLAHSEPHYSKLGRIVAEAKQSPIAAAYDHYSRLFMEGLARHASAKRHYNVLEHMMGYFSKELSKEERQELLEVMNDFRQRLIPLVVPLTLFRHYVKKYRVTYLENQIYLQPSPKELMLRNHV